MMLLCIFLVLLHCGSSQGFTTSTQAVPPTIESIRVSLCNQTNPCLNGGTCHEQSLDDDEECSADPGMGVSVCHCPQGFTGARCEIQTEGKCNGRDCLQNERCVLVDDDNVIYKCINDYDTSELTAPRCQPGLHEVNYTLDMLDRDKHVVCLDMYYTSNHSYCHDIDSSIDFEIHEEEVSNLFCLKIDYTDWRTCIAINKTFNRGNFPDKPEIDVTLLASENDKIARTASITFHVVFNEAPRVTLKTRSYFVNMGTETNPYTIDLENDFGVWDDERVVYSLEIEDPRLTLTPSSGSLLVRLKDRDIIVARVKITDEGIPKMSTTITVIIEVLTLNCMDTRSKFYVELSGQETTSVGQIQCTKSPGFALTHSALTSTGFDVQIDSNGFVRATQRTPGTYTLEVTVAIEGKLNVRIPRIDVTVGAIKTCTFALPNEDFRSIDSSRLGDNVATQIKSLTPMKVDVDILLFRQGNPGGHVEVYFLMLADSQTEVNDVHSSINLSVQSGSLGNLTIGSNSYQCYDKVGLARITDDIAYNSRDPENNSSSTRNNTYVELTCHGFFLLPVGEVTMQWRMTSKNAPVVPLPLSRLQTSQTSPATDVYVGTLKASNILHRDSGPFTCRITDNAGNDDSRRLDVRVIAEPVVSLLPFGQAFIEASERLTLTCRVVEPLGTDTNLTWFRDDVAVASEVAVTQSQYEVVGSTMKSSSFYCQGQNVAGTGGQSRKLSVTITTAVRCVEEDNWPGTIVGTLVEAPCSEGMSGQQTRTCGNDGTWLTANTSQCVSNNITDVITDIQWILDGVQVGTLSSVTTKLTENTMPETLESKEIELVSQSLETLLDISRSNTTLYTEDTVQFTQSFIGTASNLLDPKTADTWKDISERPTSILDHVDSVGGLAADTLLQGQKQYITSNNIDIVVGKTNLLNQDAIVFPTNSTREDDIALNSFLIIPAVTVERNAFTGPTSYSSVYYKNLTDQLPKGRQSSTDNSSLIVNSHTLAFNFYSSSNVTLDPPLTINFTHENNLIIDRKPQCVFLNTATYTWESDGCNATHSNQFYTICVCSHLTNFAILMNPTNQAVKNLAIQIITYVGCGISVFCLTLTVIIYVTVWRYVKNDQAVLIVNSCVCLGVSMMLFLVGIDKTSNEIACKAIAVLLHFFYLVTFFAMLACGLEILWTVVQVFATRSKIKPLLIGAWILPLVIVAISMASTSLEGYGTKTACWLSTENSLIYAFIGPVLLIIIINFIIIGKLVHTLLNMRSMEDKSMQTKIKKGLRGICILVPVLGVSWVIGIFAFNEQTVVFQYIFAVMNSLQGLFIFITQVCLSTKVKKGLARYKQSYSSGDFVAKPADAQSQGAGNIGLQNRNREESSAYANLLEPVSESSGYLRPIQGDEGPSGVYDLPEDQAARRVNPYSGLEDNKRVSNVYNEIAPDRSAEGYTNFRSGQGYNDQPDPTYRNIGVPVPPPTDGEHDTSTTYYNMSVKGESATGARVEPLGASDVPEALPPLPARRDFIPYGARNDARTGSEHSPPPLMPKPRGK